MNDLQAAAKIIHDHLAIIEARKKEFQRQRERYWAGLPVQYDELDRLHGFAAPMPGALQPMPDEDTLPPPPVPVLFGLMQRHSRAMPVFGSNQETCTYCRHTKNKGEHCLNPRCPSQMWRR